MERFKSTNLWRILENSEFAKSIADLRAIAEPIATQIARVLPGYTDHSIRHMDELWRIADQVITKDEFGKFSVGEAFVLACSFYFHDIGMGVAATEIGIKELKTTKDYRDAYEKLKQIDKYDEKIADSIALEVAARSRHADIAQRLPLTKFPGTDRFLIENTEVREKWGEMIGEVSASHHWSIQTLDAQLGRRNGIPDPTGGQTDLGYVACMLRIIDFAHFNIDRANTLEKLLRSKISLDSLVHWKAQERTTGPTRDNSTDLLIYGCTSRVTDLDAWWLAYDNLKGLDTEICAVREYLADRAVSAGRFSLKGVKGIKDAVDFSRYFQTDGFEPIDVQIRSNSIERLINILSGKTLYGEDIFAPLRELVQNARDAVDLRLASDKIANRRNTVEGQIGVQFLRDGENSYLIVEDNGVGMTTSVLTKYLLGIASDYWESPEFISEYPGIAAQGFRPIGRFGIGFLSVFMISDEIEIETRKFDRPEKLVLKIRGAGKRGSLRRVSDLAFSGTRIRLKLKTDVSKKYEKLRNKLRQRSPMLNVAIAIKDVDGEATIEPQWWMRASQKEFANYMDGLQDDLTLDRRISRFHRYSIGGEEGGIYEQGRAKWVSEFPEAIAENYRIMAFPEASLLRLCSNGITVADVQASGIFGVVELGPVDINAARDQVLNWNLREFKSEVLKKITPKIISGLEEIGRKRDVLKYFGFLASVVEQYSVSVLRASEIPWIGVFQEPGNYRLVSSSEAITMLGKVKAIFVAHDQNPWEATTLLSSRFPKEKRTDIPVFVISNKNQQDPYVDEDGTHYGPLDQFYDADRRNLNQAELLNTFIHIVSEAWNMDMKSIIGAKWAAKRYGTLCGLIERQS